MNEEIRHLHYHITLAELRGLNHFAAALRAMLAKVLANDRGVADGRATTIAFIQELSAVLKKHKAGLLYTTDDDGIHVTIGDSYATTENIGWPTNGESKEIDDILSTANK